MAYPKALAADNLSGFYVRNMYPFKAVHCPYEPHATPTHEWNVADRNGNHIFAGMLSMAAAYEIEEKLNMRAAKEIMLSNNSPTGAKEFTCT